ncbi:MAG TPA: DNA mismatch repair endonuclease MutL [Roseiflexaceae bacterium]|nr:DNA mismatch repair endonuclease MutL [Roseiflexaceae bacterium]
MPIRVLDPTIAAQIAAGEVVERPASVVRELVENALDAGARRITVEARGGGLREIKVQDDGCGIPAAEVELAFMRHATSKLASADDLWDIHTLGFRGEALPSIASVAQVVCITRAATEEVGTELRIAGGELQARAPRGCTPGTALSVRNLFYNTPVRREFLRSEATEAAAISATVTQYALAYPEVRFTLLLDGRLALQTSGGGDLRAALVEVYGLDTARQLLAVDTSFGEDREAIRVRGMVSPPGLTRSSRSALHLFVNRRAVAARGQLVAVVEEAYHTLMMKGRHPLAVLDIRVHPAAVDVNIHPTKAEVKFRDAPRVLGVIGRAVRDTLVDSGVRPWAEAGAPLPVETAQRRFELRRIGGRWEEPERRDWGAFEPQGEHPSALNVARSDEEGLAGHRDAYRSDQETFNVQRPNVQAKLPPLRIVGQVAQAYIVAESPDGMYLVDQHAAHERITYERLMRQRGAGAVERQTLLIPQVVDLPPAAQSLLLASAEQLEEWGFVLEEFGPSLRVRAVPAVVHMGNLAQALLEVADRLAGRGGSSPADWREAMLTTLSCHTSVRAGQTLSLDEMRELLAQLERCDSPRTCPHGRPTMILLTTTMIERQFGRIQ